MKLKTTDHIYKSAYDLYCDYLPYHNFNHIKETLNYAEDILKKCDVKNIDYDANIICHAILFHDAGYDLEHRNIGFDNKEKYSAFLAESILSDCGEPKEHIEKVKRAILSTHMDAICHSNNDMIVRAADLIGLTSPYCEFKEKTMALFKEREILSHEKITWEQYKKEAYKIIHGFLKSQINLDIDLFAKENYVFHTKVFYNLDKLMKDRIDYSNYSPLNSTTSSATKV